MNTLLSSLYNLLSYLTEDAVAHKLYHTKLPTQIIDLMNQLCIALGDYLDNQD